MDSVWFLFCFYQRPETFLGHLARWLWGHLETLGVLGGQCLPPVGLFYYNVCKLSFQFQFYERSTGGSYYHYSVIFFPLTLGSFTECEKCALTTRLQAWWQQRHILCISIPGQEELYFGLHNLRRPACTHFPGILSLLYIFFFASHYVLSSDPQCYFLLLTILLGNHYRNTGAELCVMRGKVRCPIPEEPCCCCSDPSTLWVGGQSDSGPRGVCLAAWGWGHNWEVTGKLYQSICSCPSELSKCMVGGWAANGTEGRPGMEAGQESFLQI